MKHPPGNDRHHDAADRVGGYDFSEQRAWEARRGMALSAEQRERKREAFLAGIRVSPTFARAVAQRGWDMVRPPAVTVLTAAQTYSARFDVTTLLYRLGARVVGVPSAQAGTCFIDTLRYRLTHSGLHGYISFKWSVTFPDDPERGEVLRPHVQLTYAKLAAYAFDRNSAVLLAMET